MAFAASKAVGFLRNGKAFSRNQVLYLVLRPNERDDYLSLVFCGGGVRFFIGLCKFKKGGKSLKLGAKKLNFLCTVKCKPAGVFIYIVKLPS